MSPRDRLIELLTFPPSHTYAGGPAPPVVGLPAGATREQRETWRAVIEAAIGVRDGDAAGLDADALRAVIDRDFEHDDRDGQQLHALVDAAEAINSAARRVEPR